MDVLLNLLVHNPRILSPYCAKTRLYFFTLIKFSSFSLFLHRPGRQQPEHPPPEILKHEMFKLAIGGHVHLSVFSWQIALLLLGKIHSEAPRYKVALNFLEQS